jgi:hypothetical protein
LSLGADPLPSIAREMANQFQHLALFDLARA